MVPARAIAGHLTASFLVSGQETGMETHLNGLPELQLGRVSTEDSVPGSTP